MIESSRVRLESPFPAPFLPAVWRWMQPFKRRIWSDNAPETCEAFVKEQPARLNQPGYAG